MINGIIYLLLLFTLITPTSPASATPNYCQELAAELTVVQDQFDFTDEEIRDFYQRCVTAEAWGTDKV